MLDHVHMLISIPPKHSVSTIVGFIKGKSSIWIAQNIGNKHRNFVGHKFWARGYFVSTVSANEEVVRKYLQLLSLCLQRRSLNLSILTLITQI